VSRTLLYQLLSCFLCCPEYWDVFRDCAADKLTAVLQRTCEQVDKHQSVALENGSLHQLGEIMGRDITWQHTSEAAVAAALDWPLVRLLDHQLQTHNLLAKVKEPKLNIAQMLSALLKLAAKQYEEDRLFSYVDRMRDTARGAPKD
jgi:hypothetical protein